MIVAGELMPVLEDADWDTALGAIKNTVEEPSYITADASRDRIQLAHDAGSKPGWTSPRASTRRTRLRR